MPDRIPKGVTHYTLQARCVKKDREISHSLSFSVGANCVRPRVFCERPYEDDFLSAGKICFMVGARFAEFFVLLYLQHRFFVI